MRQNEFKSKEGYVHLKEPRIEFPEGREINAQCLIHTTGTILEGNIEFTCRDCYNGVDGVIIDIPKIKDQEFDRCRFCNHIFLKKQYPKNVNGCHLGSCPCRTY